MCKGPGVGLCLVHLRCHKEAMWLEQSDDGGGRLRGDADRCSVTGSFSVAAITKDHSWVPQKNRNIASHSPGGQESGIQISAGPHSLGLWAELFLNSSQLLSMLGILWLKGACPFHLFLHCHMAILSLVYLCLHLAFFSS